MFNISSLTLYGVSRAKGHIRNPTGLRAERRTRTSRKETLVTQMVSLEDVPSAVGPNWRQGGEQRARAGATTRHSTWHTRLSCLLCKQTHVVSFLRFTTQVNSKFY